MEWCESFLCDELVSVTTLPEVSYRLWYFLLFGWMEGARESWYSNATLFC
jgi:hypothetical protein